MSDFLAYWTPATADSQRLKGGTQDHAASAQYRRVDRGDSVWLVTIRSGRLRLVTRIVVGHITDQKGAAKLLGVRPKDLWDAEYHILAVVGTACEIAERDIHHLAPQLRFESTSGNDRLIFGENGEANAQQLQTMRKLSQVSAALLAMTFEFRLPDEILPSEGYSEGGVSRVTVNRYERDPQARRAWDASPARRKARIDAKTPTAPARLRYWRRPRG